MDVCLMIEGQEGVGWEDWRALAAACEDAGLAGLFRSDHYVSIAAAHQRGALDAWATLAALAATTERLRLGTLVSPATFRHPSELAKVVTTVDHVSGGRIELGLGAGWYELEHTAHGFDFPAMRTRMDRFEEQIEIVARSWREDAFDFDGEHYVLRDCHALPKPVSDPHPTLIVGGLAGPRSARVAARFADEYNTVFATVEDAARRRENIAKAWEQADRDPAGLRYSIMTGCVVGSSPAEVEERSRAVMARQGEDGDPAAWADASRESGWIVGTPDEVVDHLGRLSTQAGVTRVMLQHLPHTDTDMVALLGEVATHVR